MSVQDVALDACCLINLCAASKILHAGSGLGLNLHVPSKVVAETLYTLQPDPDDPSRLVKHPIDLDGYTAAGVLQKCDVIGREEIELFVQIAVQLGDGEAACYAVAKTRGWMLATDDRRARKFAGQAGIPVISTPELVKLWVERTRPSHVDTVTVLENIQRFAYFVPRPNSPEYAWWVGYLGGNES